MNASANRGSGMPALLLRRAAIDPSGIIMRRKDRGIWKAITWAELAQQVQAIGGALLSLGLGAGDTAAVLAETRPESVYADLAIQGAGAASLAIHPDAEAGRIADILHHAACRVLFVENEEQLDKVLTIRSRCPALLRVVIFDMKGLRDFADTQCIALADFVGRGDAGPGWAEAVGRLSVDDPAIMLAPRGQAGRVLTHRELTRMVADAQDRLHLRQRDTRLAVLSMAETAERIWGLYLALETGCVSHYLEGPETAGENLQELQPTVFGADADAWSFLHARATRAGQTATATQRLAYGWALRAGRAGGASAALAHGLVLHAVRRELGLSRVRLAYVGGAPLSEASREWARCLGITVEHIDDGRQSSSGQTQTGYQAQMQATHV